MAELMLWNEDVSSSMQTSTVAAATTLGVAFYPSVDGYVEQVGWGRNSVTADNRRPSAIGLWDASSGVKMAEVIPAASDTSNAGWFWSALFAPIFVKANQVVIVAAQYPGTGGAVWRFWYRPNTNLPTPDAGLNFHASYTRTLAGGWAFPTGMGAGSLYALDVKFNTEYNPNPTNPSTVGSVANELAAWLHAEDATEPRSTPVLNHVLLNALTTSLNETKQLTQSLVDLGIAALIGGVDDKVDAVKGVLDAIWTVAPENRPATYDFVETEVGSAKTEILTAIDAIPTGGGGTVYAPFAIGTDYTQVAQTVGQGSFEWIQPADAYTILFEDVAETGRTVRDVGGVNIFWARAWAKPWDGVRMYPHHIEFSGPLSVIMSDRKWPGILCWLPPDVEWTITAFDKTEV